MSQTAGGKYDTTRKIAGWMIGEMFCSCTAAENAKSLSQTEKKRKEMGMIPKIWMKYNRNPVNLSNTLKHELWLDTKYFENLILLRE